MSRPVEEATGTRRSRLRIVVLQALVLSLFATLLGRLYFLQVVALAVVWDLLLTPLVLPLVLGMFRQLEPDRAYA